MLLLVNDVTVPFSFTDRHLTTAEVQGLLPFACSLLYSKNTHGLHYMLKWILMQTVLISTLLIIFVRQRNLYVCKTKKDLHNFVLDNFERKLKNQPFVSLSTVAGKLSG